MVRGDRLALLMDAQVNERPGKFGKAFHAAKMSSVGIEVAVATLIGWGIGHWLDKELGTGPYLTILLFLCGVAAGFKALIRAGKEAQRVAMGGSIDPGAPGVSPTSSDSSTVEKGSTPYRSLDGGRAQLARVRRPGAIEKEAG